MVRRAFATSLVLLAACGGDSGAPEVEPVTEAIELAEPTGMSMESEAPEGATALFDGQSLDGWTPRGEAVWQVEGGAITPVEGSGRGFLVTNQPYDDFRLAVEFWVDETANGGVFFRVPAEGDINQGNSFEVNIFDAHADWPTGSINEFEANEGPQTVGQWNTFEITAEGDRLGVLLNGEQVVDTEGQRLASGPIALQYNGAGTIRYRNIQIQPL